MRVLLIGKSVGSVVPLLPEGAEADLRTSAPSDLGGYDVVGISSERAGSLMNRFREGLPVVILDTSGGEFAMPYAPAWVAGSKVEFAYRLVWAADRQEMRPSCSIGPSVNKARSTLETILSEKEIERREKNRGAAA